MAITSISSTKQNNTYIINKSKLVDSVGNLTALDVDTVETDVQSTANVGYVTETYDKVRSKSYVHAICDLSIYNFADLVQTTNFVFDDVIVPINARILCINDSSGYNNGIWTVQDINGTFSLTRPTDYNIAGDVMGSDVFVAFGTEYAKSLWISSTDETISSAVIGTFPISVNFLIDTSHVYVQASEISEAQYYHTVQLAPSLGSTTGLGINSSAKIKSITISTSNINSISDLSIVGDKTYVASSDIDCSISTDFVYAINSTTACGSLSLNLANPELFTDGTLTIKLEYTL